MIPARARGLGETYRLARAAAAKAGVTRLADISGLADLGLPVFQAIRPFARSLTVSQGKGATPLAARVSALLEACELACAEALLRPAQGIPLARMPGAVRRCWEGDGEPLTIALDPMLARAWVDGRVLGSGDAMAMPWDLLSLDFTRAPLEYPANSDGLATGNTRDEALFGALAELLEYDLVARFERLSPPARRALQIDCESIDSPQLGRELARVRAAGFTPRLWNLGQDHGIPAFACKLFAPEPAMDRMTPTGGSACHPDPATAALGALREAVQGRAALVAGARDDITVDDYRDGRNRALALIVATLAVDDGRLSWREVRAPDCNSTADGLSFLRCAIAALTSLPVVVFDHRPPVPGLHVVHALAPGLLNLSRRRAPPGALRRRPTRPVQAVGVSRPTAILFAGPSIAGLAIPAGIELRPPAICGDLAALLSDPPAAVGLVDGHFGIAPTVWHKEILNLLACGVRVLGAASIGALRAAELGTAGMEGVGTIHAAYQSGVIERDDAVMLLQASVEFGFAPLTLPLVDAEHVLQGLACDMHARRMMQRIVRTMSYETRSWERCLAVYRARTGCDFPVPLTELAAVPSLKRQDAALLIERLAQAARAPAASRRDPSPPLTSHYLRMLAKSSAAAVPALW